MKKEFKKDFVITKENNRKFRKAIKCRICGDRYIDGYSKVRDHCDITEK